jgi:O-antigen/teichoic acid export membrane protein
MPPLGPIGQGAVTSTIAGGELESTRIAASAILMMLSKAISHLCFLLIAVVLARSLERADFGTFNQVWLVNKSLLYLFALGLPVSVYYFLPRLPDAKIKSFVLQTMASLAILALPLSISMYLLADWLAIYFNNPALGYYLRLFAIYPLITLPTVSTAAMLIGLGRAKEAALFEIVTKTAMVTAVAAAGVLERRLDLVFKTLVLYGVAQLLLGVWMVWYPIRKIKFRFSLPDWKSQIAFAAPYGLATLAGALNYQVDKVLIALFYPPAVFALYAAGAFEIPLAGVTAVPVISVIMGELTKKFTSGDIGGFLRLWHQSMLKLALPVFAFAAFLMVFAEPVVVGLFSSEYAAAVGPFRVFLLFLPLRITMLEQVLASLGETRFVLRAQVVTMFVNIVLGYALIRTAGWLGPAIAALLAVYLFAGFVIFAIRSRLNVSLDRLVPWPQLVRVALVAILAAGCSGAVALLATHPLWKLAAGSAVFVIVYLMGNLKTKSITTDDLQTLWSWVLMTPWSSTRKQILGSENHK